MTSHGSTVAASETGAPPKPAEFDTIEAEIDAIKADVQHMRAEAAGKQKLGERDMTSRQHAPPARAEGSKIPAPDTSRLASAKPGDSSRTRTETGMTISQGKAPASSGQTSRAYVQTSTSRTRGFATAVISPTSETSTASMKTALQEQSPTTSSPTTTQNGSPVKYRDALEYPQASSCSEKSSPHFAQPTQAATRRVDETLRRDNSPAKSSPETSPGKSTKAKTPNFETDKRALQRGQKRTSLPEGWMSNSEPSSPAEKGAQRKEQVTPGSAASLTSADQSPAGPKLRKKTSSYMSPTKSAQHRSIATIGEEKRTRVSPRVGAAPLRINTNLASKDATTTSPSASRRGTGNVEAIISPRSQLSSTLLSKKESSAPLKTTASASNSPPSAADRPSLVIRLPLPLPNVANTTMTRRDSDEDILDPIKEKLEKEDLLRRNTTRGDVLAPVFARLERTAKSRGLLPAQPLRLQAEEPRSTGQPRARDSDNEPMSRLISGLRGQSSAAIGKALAGGQHEAASAPSASFGKTGHSTEPAIFDESRKRSGDPAILYQGRKPSTSDGLPQDPAIIFNSGPVNLDVPVNPTRSRKESPHSSLRATATDFVPDTMSGPTTQAEMSRWEPEVSGDTWWPRGQSLFDDDEHQDHGTGSLLDMGFLPENPRRSYYGIYQPLNTETWQEEPMPVPLNLNLSRHVDIIHGEFPYNTPTVSPTSNDTSPRVSDEQDRRNLAQWEIIGKGRRKFHWTGGDGLEISFKGLGPDAEHDPNSPVLYRNYRANTKTLHMQAASYPRTHVPGSTLPPNAPKLMREYAEKMGFSQIPCLEDQWSGKYDCMPTIVPLPGLCGPCKAGDKALHRIGGGIDLVS